MEPDRPGPLHVATFCGQCSCGCPELFVDPTADDDRRVVITDDFGQRIQMSVEQFRALVDETVNNGLLDRVDAALAAT